MDTMSSQMIFIRVLRFELCEMALDDALKVQLTPDVVEKVCSLAKAHDVVHTVSSALYKAGLLQDANLLSKIKREEMIAAYRHEQLQYAYEQLCDTFEEMGIPFVPLKGSVLRPYYPRESMRSSCDIDILIHEEDVERAVEALTGKGFAYDERSYHDVSLHASSSVHLELHFSIQENRDELDRVLKRVWSYVVPTQGNRCALSNEFLLFYHFAHMYYHFATGGCGIRSLMDIWVMKTKMGLSYAQAQPLLEEAGINSFAAQMSKLVDICFGDAPSDGFTDALIDYIISGGTYGTQDNKLSIERMRGGSMIAYGIRRVFFPYKVMVCIYPVLKRFPFLLPFCYAARLGKLLRRGKMKDSIEELKGFKTITDQHTQPIEYIWKRLGIK